MSSVPLSAMNQEIIRAHSQPLVSPLRLFPKPLFQMTRNSRVPRSTLTPRGIKSTGFVQPQGEANLTNTVRATTFEQNFIRRLMVNIDNSFKDGGNILDFKRYQTRLQSPDCSREEAIFLYDELIAILLILVLYMCYVTSEILKGGKPSLNPVKLTKMYDFQKYSFLIHTAISLVGASSPLPIMLTLLGVTGITLTGGTAAGLLIAGGVIFVACTMGTMVFKENRIARGYSIENQKKNLFFTLQYILNTILDTRNTIPASTVKGELKYWGLTQAQVDYFFSNNIPSPERVDFPEIPAVGENGIENENQREELVQARQAQMELYNYTVEHNEEFGFKRFGLQQIIQFIQLAQVNPEELAPNEPFSLSVINSANRLKLNTTNIPRLVGELGRTSVPNPIALGGGATGGRRKRTRRSASRRAKRKTSRRVA